MLTLCTNQVDQWQHRHELDSSTTIDRIGSALNIQSSTFPASKTFYLSSLLCKWLLVSQPAKLLLVVTEWGIWPSSENMPLFVAWRRSHGCVDALDAAPGHLCSPDEQAEAISLIQMALIFGWGLRGTESSGSLKFQFDHDGRLELFASKPDALPEVIEALRDILGPS